MTKIIKHQFFFPHPPETVWEYLTKPELMELWLMKTSMLLTLPPLPKEGCSRTKSFGENVLQ